MKLISKTDLALCLKHFGASLIVQLVKNPPAMQETLVQSLGQEDPLEGNSQPQSDSTERLSLHFKLFYWNDWIQLKIIKGSYQQVF